MYVYLAGPIDSANEGTRDRVHRAKSALRSRQIPFYSPDDAWNVNGGVDGLAHQIVQANEVALRGSIVVLAVVDGISIGVPAEMQFARQHEIPVVAWASEEMQRHAVLGILASAGLYSKLDDAVVAVENLMVLGSTPDTKVGLILREPQVRDLPVPAQALDGDIGLDLYTSKQIVIPSHEFRGLPCAIRLAPPPGVWFLILGRSSALHKKGLIVPQSVIDNGYRGEIFAMAYNITDCEQVVERGERVAQLIPLPLTRFKFHEVDALPDSERGTAGFGSTGEGTAVRR